MIYTPRKTLGMWDTWCFFNEGTHFLYYLHRTDPDITSDGISLAVSRDGVHWEEHGEIIHKLDDAANMGSGAVWKADGKFVMNFSEMRDGVQSIFFAVSDDLVKWTRLGNEYRSDPDPRWYKSGKDGRWDNLWAIRKTDGSFIGYFAAKPKGGPMDVPESVGCAVSRDGLHWEAAPPPAFEWDDWGPLKTHEVGAVEKIGDRYWMLMGAIENVLGIRSSAGWAKEDIGMFLFSAPSPEGPFRVEPASWRFLTGPADRFLMTYFARFYPVPDHMLVCHHSIEPPLPGKFLVFAPSYMAPLKEAVPTTDGRLVPSYWKGNDALKGKTLAINFADVTRWPEGVGACEVKGSDGFLEMAQPNASGVMLLKGRFDLETGVVIEGSVEIQRLQKPWAAGGFLIEAERNPADLPGSDLKGTAVLLETRGCVEIGTLLAAFPEDPFLTRIERQDLKPFQISAGQRLELRLLLRKHFFELYLDDRLVQCFTMSSKPTGRIGCIIESGKIVLSNMKAWRMNL
jgi:hypothetical protein